MTMPEEVSALIKEGKFNPSQIKVTEGGKNVVRPDVMNFLMLASIASQTTKVRKYFDDRTSAGWTQNFALIITPVVQEVKCDFPAQTFYIINDGASPIFVTINFPGRTPTPLNATEDLFLDFETHKLEYFRVWCAPAGAATARAMVKG